MTDSKEPLGATNKETTLPGLADAVSLPVTLNKGLRTASQPHGLLNHHRPPSDSSGLAAKSRSKPLVQPVAKKRTISSNAQNARFRDPDETFIARENRPRYKSFAVPPSHTYLLMPQSGQAKALLSFDTDSSRHSAANMSSRIVLLFHRKTDICLENHRD